MNNDDILKMAREILWTDKSPISDKTVLAFANRIRDLALEEAAKVCERGEQMKEHDLVVLQRSLCDVPAGTVGTIIHIYSLRWVEVEFPKGVTMPVHTEDLKLKETSDAAP